ncbi:MAG: hypothetical protein L0F95_08780, partial [Lactococcus sp.]
RYIMAKEIDVEIPKKFGDKKYIADFYSLSEKTVANQIGVMRKNQEYLSANCFRLSGRVWLPAFDKFLLEEKKKRFK